MLDHAPTPFPAQFPTDDMRPQEVWSGLRTSEKQRPFPPFCAHQALGSPLPAKSATKPIPKISVLLGGRAV